MSAAASAAPRGMRGERCPFRSFTSGLFAGSPGTTAGPFLVPPAKTASAFATEKPLLFVFAEWQAWQLAVSIGRTFSSKMASVAAPGSRPEDIAIVRKIRRTIRYCAVYQLLGKPEMKI